MTALTAAARPEQDASPRPLPWRRMAWVTWRQHRIALAGVALLLGGLAVWLWLEGMAAHHAYTTAVDCHPASSGACGALVGYFLNQVVLRSQPNQEGSFLDLVQETRERLYRALEYQDFPFPELVRRIAPPGVARGICVGGALLPAKTGNQIGHSLADEMVLECPAFKTEAGSGEV